MDHVTSLPFKSASTKQTALLVLPVLSVQAVLQPRANSRFIQRVSAHSSCRCPARATTARVSRALRQTCRSRRHDFSNGVCSGHAPFSLHRTCQSTLAACPHRRSDQSDTCWCLARRDPVRENEALTLRGSACSVGFLKKVRGAIRQQHLSSAYRVSLWLKHNLSMSRPSDTSLFNRTEGGPRGIFKTQGRDTCKNRT